MQNLLKRYRMILPTEHGSWSLMLTPFVIGAGVAGKLPSPVWLCLIAVLALFLARQPITLWVRVRRGKGRRANGPAALFWSIILLVIGGLAGIGLLAMGRLQVLWLGLPAVGILIITLAITTWKGPRQLSTELIGVIGLALAAPAAYVAATGQLDLTAWLTWGVSAAHSVISVLYVRLRIDERHDRATYRQAMAVVAAHAFSLAAAVGLALGGVLPPLLAIPVGLLLIRALYAAWRKPPLNDVKRFGFTEMGLALGFAALVIAAFVLGR